jgi:hypothetical protein
MDSSSRRVQAERNRNRLPPRRKAYRWTRRIAGVLATLAFIGVGVAIASMVMPDKDSTSASAAIPTATPAKHPTKKKAAVKKKKPAKAKGPTKAQREALKAAIAVVRQKGYTTLKPSDYNFKATFRVLIGRPVGDSGGGSRAFFFSKDQFLGNDALNPPTASTPLVTRPAPRARRSGCASGSRARRSTRSTRSRSTAHDSSARRADLY